MAAGKEWLHKEGRARLLIKRVNREDTMSTGERDSFGSNRIQICSNYWCRFVFHPQLPIPRCKWIRCLICCKCLIYQILRHSDLAAGLLLGSVLTQLVANPGSGNPGSRNLKSVSIDRGLLCSDSHNGFVW